jgi:hypothetical protein
MVVGAMTGHGDMVAWCVESTSARPWLVAEALLCKQCCDSDGVTLSHMCKIPEKHCPQSGWRTAALLAACQVGDMPLLRRLMRDHRECVVAVRDRNICDEVSGHGAGAHGLLACECACAAC